MHSRRTPEPGVNHIWGLLLSVKNTGHKICLAKNALSFMLKKHTKKPTTTGSAMMLNGMKLIND